MLISGVMRASRALQEESGSISPLIMVYFVIAMSLTFLISNLASVYIARRDLINLTEGALSRAVQELDEVAYYYQLPIPEMFTGESKKVPINCSDAGRTFSREIALLATSKLDLYGQSLAQVNGDITLKAFNCDGKTLSVTLQQVHQLPFKLRVFGITEFTNQVEVSMQSIYQ
jgi:hypothetical protein